MAEPFLGEVRIYSFDFAPKYWAVCNGQELPIAQNQALFSLLGNMYGGDGKTYFKLPDLRWRVPIHTDDRHPIGSSGGEAEHKLTEPEMASHTHMLQATNAQADQARPGNGLLARVDTGTLGSVYSQTAARVSMSDRAIATTGKGNAHENRQPFLTLNFCIALAGVYPPRN